VLTDEEDSKWIGEGGGRLGAPLGDWLVVAVLVASLLDKDLRGSAPMYQTQPLRRKIRSMPQDIGPDQDSPTTTSAPSFPERITRNKAQALGVEHQ